MEKKYRICSHCIMDTTDPNITFNDEGICNYCQEFPQRQVYMCGKDETEKQKRLEQIVSKMKKDGMGKEYDCVLGISGGVDSAYMAYMAHRLGLRVLAIHVDAGWNSEVAVMNIQKMCEKLNLELHTIVIDWTTMKELQRAYMFSGLPNLDIPQDHVFLSAIYDYAYKYKIKYILNGANLATEGILPTAWGYSNLDWRCIKSVYKKCGRNLVTLRNYPHMNIIKYALFRYLGVPEMVRLLNYIPYSKKDAMATLEKEFGWTYYGGKHFESRFTKFFQSYYLPHKFGYDKKRAHLSSLIVGGEMTREEALKEMEDSSDYPEEEQLEDRDYILKKLDISLEEWNDIMKAPRKTEDDYANDKKAMALLRKIKK